MSEASINDFALLSDCQSAALVDRDGSVDWYCPSRFDAPPVFARMLDPEGGHWLIRPSGERSPKRYYLEDTMVLRTEFDTPQGRAAVTDALAFEEGERGHEIGQRVPHTLLRRVEGLEGEVELEMEFAPRLEYGLSTALLLETETGLVARSGPTDLYLDSETPLEINGPNATSSFTVGPGESVGFALTYRRAYADHDGSAPDVDVGKALENTTEGWKSWAEQHQGYDGPYAEQVRRSALVLQALTYAPSGAVIAAATTSLPETLGSELNWDYRYVWLRDLGLTLRALWIAACPDEPQQFFNWVDRATSSRLESEDNVQIMFGVEGERDLAEQTLDRLQGFRQSYPVRTGNDAWHQKQLDVLGEVVDAAHLLREQLGEEFDEVTARLVTTFADRAAERWREPDAGMWEARDAERQYLTSKVMCWVALDRAIDLAPRLGGRADVETWKAARGEIHRTVLDKGWSEKTGAYAGALGSDNLDASVLLLPLVGFLPADDPRMRATIDTIERELMPDGLVHRWAGDDNGGFLLCSYWLSECRALSGDKERAVEIFEQTTAYANDLGLLAEEADGETGELLGNFPQAFSHVGLINAAWRLSQT